DGVTVSPLSLPSLTHNSSYFCYAYGHHRDLHSFPTRRSSDLPSSRTQTSEPSRAIRRYSMLSGSCVACVRSCEASTRSRSSRWRSEEHTSELQSRFDLVCRLLLEKKKINEINT